MDYDKQAHEKREHASWVRRALECIGLKSIVIYDDLLQNGEIIPAGTWTPNKPGVDIDNFVLNGKTLYVRKILPSMAERRQEEQEITCPIPPDSGKYSITFYDEKFKKSVTIGPLDINATTLDIRNALFLSGLGDIVVTGDLLSGIKFTFAGRFSFQHQLKVVVDSSKLKRANKPLALAPEVRRNVPKDNYCIVQQEGDKQFYALLRQDRLNPNTWIPAIPFFFTKNRAFKDEGLEVEDKNGGSRHYARLRQKEGKQK